MIDTIFITPNEALDEIAAKVRQKRLSLNLTQQSLSNKSGVSYAVIKKFELTGKISLESLLKIAFALGSLDGFFELFKVNDDLRKVTLDDLLKQKTRKRGRK